MKKILLLSVIVIFVGCATSVSTQLANKQHEKLPTENQVFVLEKNEILPTNSEFIGDVKIGDTGFTTDCGYNKVIADIKEAARNSGANIIQIIQVKEPTIFGSSCYRVKAKIYRNLDAQSLAALTESRNARNKSRLPSDSDYALIYFYRPSIGMGAMLGYKIKNDKDSIIGRLRNGEKFVYKTKNFGSQSFYGVLETKEEVQLHVEKGKEYFVRCSVNMGVVLGRPEINLIESHVGRKDYDRME